MKQSKKVVARIIILILALFTVIPGTVSQKVYAEPGGSESNQAADASKDDSNKKEEKKTEEGFKDAPAASIDDVSRVSRNGGACGCVANSCEP